MIVVVILFEVGLRARDNINFLEYVSAFNNFEESMLNEKIVEIKYSIN